MATGILMFFTFQLPLTLFFMWLDKPRGPSFHDQFLADAKRLLGK